MTEQSDQLFQKDLLRYLSGEISFETWLDNQGNTNFQISNEQSQDSQNNISGISEMVFETSHESATVFSSWGTAFTSYNAQKTNMNQNSNQPDEEIADSDLDVVEEELSCYENLSKWQILHC